MNGNATDQILTNSASWQSFWAFLTKKAQVAKPVPWRHLDSKAGDRIRTGDVQLGKMPFGAQVVVVTLVISVFRRQKRGAHWVTTRCAPLDHAEPTEE